MIEQVDKPDKELSFLRSILNREPPMDYQPVLWETVRDNLAIVLTTCEAYERCNESLRTERDTLKIENEKNELRAGVIGNVLRYVHFMLTGTNDYEGDLCNSVQLAVDKFMEITDMKANVGSTAREDRK